MCNFYLVLVEVTFIYYKVLCFSVNSDFTKIARVRNIWEELSDPSLECFPTRATCAKLNTLQYRKLEAPSKYITRLFIVKLKYGINDVHLHQLFKKNPRKFPDYDHIYIIFQFYDKKSSYML